VQFNDYLPKSFALIKLQDKNEINRLKQDK